MLRGTVNPTQQMERMQESYSATVLLLLGVPERTVMAIMGWSSTSMAARYQHVTDAIRRQVANRVDGLI